MTQSLPTDRTTLRRKDRGVTDGAWLCAFLERAAIGTLALAEGDQPFLHMNLFVYEPATHTIFLHTALRGRARAVIESNPQVCFGVMEMGRLLPNAEALEFSVEYASAQVFGRARVVTDQAEAGRVLQLLLSKYAPHLTPGEDYRPPIDPEIKRTTVIALTVEEWVGKKKEVDPDFPGAFWYPEAGMLSSVAERAAQHDDSPPAGDEGG